MKGRIWCFVMVIVQIVSWVSATSRPFAAHDGHGVVHHPGQTPQSPQVILDSRKSFQGGIEGVKETNEEAYYRGGMSKIGSSPPSCEHKCYGCIPCVAIQVPTTTTSHSHLGVQYTNYEPEDWKCKCGPSFYTP